MYLSREIIEKYRSKINSYISDYRVSYYEDDDDGHNIEYDLLEDAYDDCYDSVNNLFESAMRDAFYYGLRLGLEKPKIIKNE